MCYRVWCQSVTSVTSSEEGGANRYGAVTFTASDPAGNVTDLYYNVLVRNLDLHESQLTYQQYLLVVAAAFYCSASYAQLVTQSLCG